MYINQFQAVNPPFEIATTAVVPIGPTKSPHCACSFPATFQFVKPQPEPTGLVNRNYVGSGTTLCMPDCMCGSNHELKEVPW